MEKLAKVLKARLQAKKGGFTLVELLIVIMIIAILAGMLLLATGSATDTATATKIINDMRAAKSAALLMYMDSGQSWDWAKQANVSDIQKSLDKYMDRPLFETGDMYELDVTDDEVSINGDDDNKRVLFGFKLTGGGVKGERVKAKLQGNAERSGLYKDDGTTYDGGETVYMVLN